MPAADMARSETLISAKGCSANLEVFGSNPALDR